MSDKDNDDGIILEPFPGDGDKPIERDWKWAIYVFPPPLVFGACWLAGIRSPSHLIFLGLLLSGVLIGMLYYLFFAESDYLMGTLQNIFRRRQ